MYYAAFVDAGFLQSEGARTIGISKGDSKIDASAVVDWLRGFDANRSYQEGRDRRHFLRAYWYDGQYDQSDPRWNGQRSFFGAIAAIPGTRVRLGHVVKRQPTWHQAVRKAVEETETALGTAVVTTFEQHFSYNSEEIQKGVDTLIVLDMVRLAERGAYADAILIAGDRDLASAVEAVQDTGRRVVLVHPGRASANVASELRHLADVVVQIPDADLARMVVRRRH